MKAVLFFPGESISDFTLGTLLGGAKNPLLSMNKPHRVHNQLTPTYEFFQSPLFFPVSQLNFRTMFTLLPLQPHP